MSVPSFNQCNICKAPKGTCKHTSSFVAKKEAKKKAEQKLASKLSEKMSACLVGKSLTSWLSEKATISAASAASSSPWSGLFYEELLSPSQLTDKGTNGTLVFDVEVPAPQSDGSMSYITPKQAEDEKALQALMDLFKLTLGDNLTVCFCGSKLLSSVSETWASKNLSSMSEELHSVGGCSCSPDLPSWWMLGWKLNENGKPVSYEIHHKGEGARVVLLYEDLMDQWYEEPIPVSALAYATSVIGSKVRNMLGVPTYEMLQGAILKSWPFDLATNTFRNFIEYNNSVGQMTEPVYIFPIEGFVANSSFPFLAPKKIIQKVNGKEAKTTAKITACSIDSCQESIELTISGLTPEEAEELVQKFKQSQKVLVAKSSMKELATRKPAIVCWPFESSSRTVNGDPILYTTRLNQDGTLSCNCPGWSMGSAKSSGGRFCKHTKAVTSEAEQVLANWKAGKPLGSQFEEVTEDVFNASAKELAAKLKAKKSDPSMDSKLFMAKRILDL